MTTLAIYTKPMGGICGRVRVYPDILASVDKALRKAKGDVLSDFVVTHIADRVVILLVYADDKEQEAADVLWGAFVDAESTVKSRNLFRTSAKPSFAQMKVDDDESVPFVLSLAASDDPQFWKSLNVPETQAVSAVSVLLCRTEGLFCTTPEFLELFASKETNEKGICPVSLCDAALVRTKVTPVAALGFTLGNGILTGPLDLFDNPAFDAARKRASEIY